MLFSYLKNTLHQKITLNEFSYEVEAGETKTVNVIDWLGTGAGLIFIKGEGINSYSSFLYMAINHWYAGSLNSEIKLITSSEYHNTNKLSIEFVPLTHNTGYYTCKLTPVVKQNISVKVIRFL